MVVVQMGIPRRKTNCGKLKNHESTMILKIEFELVKTSSFRNIKIENKNKT